MIFKARLESRKTLDKLESGTPKAITDRLLSKFEMKQEQVTFPSAFVEDFFIRELNEDKSLSEMVADSKGFNFSERREELSAEVARIGENIPWQEILSKKTISEILNNVSETMRSLGAVEEQIEALRKVQIEYVEDSGHSIAGEDRIVVNKNQVIRKAVDYISALEIIDEEIESVISVLARRVIAHELGHVADKLLGIFSSRIPLDQEWNASADGSENRSERFAETVASQLFEGEEALIGQKERMLNVAKVALVWEALSSYNQRNNTSLDILALFQIFENVADAEDKKFLIARKLLYLNAAPENYAATYDFKKLKAYFGQI